MESISMKIIFFTSFVVLLLSIDQVNSQEQGMVNVEDGCRHVKCHGGFYDKCLSCGRYCAPTCENPRPQICPQACLLNVCQCVGGTVRGPNGRCIWPSQCPKRPSCRH